MRLGLFALLTICGFLIFALTLTLVPLMPMWGNYAVRAGFLLIFGALWWIARTEHPLSRFRPVFFAYFTAVLCLSLGYFFGDWGLRLFGLTEHTAAGIAVAKFARLPKNSGIRPLSTIYFPRSEHHANSWRKIGVHRWLVTAAACNWRSGL